MASQNDSSETSLQLKEFDVLTSLFKIIPKHVGRLPVFGSRHELIWTSVDVSDKFFVIGTNVGILFVYDRAKFTIQHELLYQVLTVHTLSM